MKEIIARARDVATAPSAFFTSIAKETDVRKTSIYLFVMMVVGFLLQILSVVVVQPVFNQLFAQVVQMPVSEGTLNPALIIPSFINNILIGFILSAILTSTLHFWLKLFAKKSEWRSTFNLYVYSRTPIYLLSWLPILNIVGWIYSVYLLVVGAQKIHKLDKRTATFVIVLPIMLLFIVSTLLMIVAFSSLKNV
jgi:hypothetical protein